jgi:GT2 family glycosyltransferase
MPPRVSVVIPLYNPGALLDACLTSVTNQTYPDLEIIPVDDKGPEPLRAPLDALAAKDARVRPVFHEANLGLAGALNSGLAHASGQFVLVLEQDCELLSPNALAVAVPLLLADSTLCLTGERRLPFGEMGSPEVAITLLRDDLPAGEAGEMKVHAFSELKCDLLPRDALDKAGGFDATFRFSGEDQMLAFRLAQAGFHIRQAGALAYVLRAGGQTTVRAALKREFTYGRTQAALVMRTAFGSLRSSAAHPQGARRLSNRATSTASGAGLVLLPLAFLAGLGLPWLALFALPTAVRLGIIAARSRRLPSGIPRRARARALGIALAPIDDIVYGAGFASGAIGYMATGRS